MEDGRSPAPEIDAWLRRRLGPDVRTDARRAGRVWTVEAADRRLLLKVHRDARKYRQERAALRAWAPPLGERAPELLAHDDGLHALLCRAVAGVPMAQASLPAEEERRVHRQAGVLLARLHALPIRTDDPVPLAAAFRRRVAAWWSKCPADFPESWRGRARRHADRIEAALEGVTRVAAHRDFGPHNLCVGASDVAIIDFEHARPDWALVDVARWARDTWIGRPDLSDAFWSGYGRGRDDGLLASLVVWDAAVTLAWGLSHREEAFERAGRGALEAWLSVAA